MASVLASAGRIVVKVGSSLVTNEGQGLDHDALAGWAEQIALLTQRGREVILVSSGAIAEGMQRLEWKKRPHAVHELQAAAAVGQMGLVQAYESCFATHGLHDFPGPAHPRRPRRSQALSQRPLHVADPARTRRHPHHQRKRYGGNRRDPLRRQRYSGGPRHKPRRGGRPRDPYGPGRSLHGGSAKKRRRRAGAKRNRWRSRARTDGGRRGQRHRSAAAC